LFLCCLINHVLFVVFSNVRLLTVLGILLGHWLAPNYIYWGKIIHFTEFPKQRFKKTKNYPHLDTDLDKISIIPILGPMACRSININPSQSNWPNIFSSTKIESIYLFFMLNFWQIGIHLCHYFSHHIGTLKTLKAKNYILPKYPSQFWSMINKTGKLDQGVWEINSQNQPRGLIWRLSNFES